MLKSKFCWFLKMLVIVLLAGCSSNSGNEIRNGRKVTDDLGRTVIIPEHPIRLLPFSSSITEILYLIVNEERIVARTQNDSVPVAVLKKPVINNYPVNFEKIIEYKPDIVLAKEGIISVSDAARIEELGIPVYFQKYDNVEDIFTGINQLGEILNVSERATKVKDSLENIVNAISINPETRPKVLIVISETPVYVFGKDSYGTDLIRKAGGENAVDKIFESPFPSLRREYILQINPDVIINADSNVFFSLYPELKNTNAWKNKRIYSMDGEILSRPGPRITEAISQLKDLLHGNRN